MYNVDVVLMDLRCFGIRCATGGSCVCPGIPSSSRAGLPVAPGAAAVTGGRPSYAHAAAALVVRRGGSPVPHIPATPAASSAAAAANIGVCRHPGLCGLSGAMRAAAARHLGPPAESGRWLGCSRWAPRV